MLQKSFNEITMKITLVYIRKVSTDWLTETCKRRKEYDALHYKQTCCVTIYTVSLEPYKFKEGSTQ